MIHFINSLLEVVLSHLKLYLDIMGIETQLSSCLSLRYAMTVCSLAVSRGLGIF